MEVARGHGVGSIVTELPTEILCCQIFPRLPVESLMISKCVCKSWSSLITRRDQQFLNAYQRFHSHANNNNHLLLRVKNKAKRQQHFFTLQIDQDGVPSPATATATHILTLQPQEGCSLHNTMCVNGLVCFSFGNDRPIRVYNPCTRESTILPSLANSSTPLPKNHCRVFIGNCFGFNPLTKEYMVVQFRLSKFLREQPANCFDMVARIELQVFTLGTDSWRCVEVDHSDLPFNPRLCYIETKSVCLHGAIHWMHEEEKCILVFDLGDERFRVIPFPESYSSRFRSWTIADVGGYLAVTYNRSSLRYCSEQRLWVLKDYQNQVWVEEMVIASYPEWWSSFPFKSLCAIDTSELLVRFTPLPHASIFFYNNTWSSDSRTSSIIFPKWICQIDASAQWEVLSSYDETIAPLN